MFLHIVAFFISITLISLFIREVYPRIPQALGGAKPQCGQLDLRTSDFSEETLTALGANSSQDVVRTKELEIFFQSSSTVIVGIPQGDLFEIDRGGLAAIKVC